MSKLRLRRIRHHPAKMRHLSRTVVKGSMIGQPPDRRTNQEGTGPGVGLLVLGAPTPARAMEFDFRVKDSATDEETTTIAVLAADTDAERATKIAAGLDALTGCGATVNPPASNSVVVLPTNGFNALSYVTRYV